MARVDENLAKVRDGDRNAYHQVVADYQADVWQVLVVLLCDRERTERMVGEVFVVAYGRLQEYDPRFEFRAFIRTIARERVRAELFHNDGAEAGLKAYYDHLSHIYATERGAVNATRRLHHAFAHCATKLTDSGARILQHRYALSNEPEQISRRARIPLRMVRQTIDRMRVKMSGCIAGQLSQI